MLIVAASVFDQGWAALALDVNLTLTMLLAFGLPTVALSASRLRPTTTRRRMPLLTTLRVATAATVGSWSLLALHLARHA